MQPWILLGILAAVTSSFTNLVIKDLGIKIDEYAAGFIRNLLTLPIAWVMLLSSGIPSVWPHFWMFIAIMLPFELLLTIFYQKAFKMSAVSLIVPLISLSPLFIALVSMVVFHEKLTVYHILALLLFVAGIYILNLKAEDKHILSPILNLFHDKGAFFMLLVAVILGVTVSFGKQAIIASSPQFFTAIYYSFVTLLLFPIYKAKSEVGIRKFLKHKKPLLLLAILNPLALLLVFYAFKTGPAALVQSLNSTSTLFTVILAGTFLREKGINKRLFASLLILTGTIITVIT